MKRIADIAGALLASLRPSSNKQEIDSYGQSSLPEEEERGIREWLFASLMNAGYFGKAHLIWDSGNQIWDKPTLTGVLREERCGVLGFEIGRAVPVPEVLSPFNPSIFSY